jgi:hypothetical protein
MRSNDNFHERMNRTYTIEKAAEAGLLLRLRDNTIACREFIEKLMTGEWNEHGIPMLNEFARILENFYVIEWQANELTGRGLNYRQEFARICNRARKDREVFLSIFERGEGELPDSSQAARDSKGRFASHKKLMAA